jgi:glycine/D-amino acid oxidase-like deaminating enzyme
MVDPNANRVDIGIPVLIVGAGPAGLTLALALTRYGVPALTVEKHPSTAHDGNVQPRPPTATELCAGGVRPPNWTWGTRRCRGAAASCRCATSTCSGLRSATR